MSQSNGYWWAHEDEDDIVRGLFCTVEMLSNELFEEFEKYDRFMGLYEIQPKCNFSLPNTFSPDSMDMFFSEGRLRMNILRPIVDAKIARIATDRVKIRFLTSGGTYSDRRKAERITKAIAALAYSSKEHFVSQLAYRDSLVIGTGFVKAYEVDEYLRLERMSPKHILVDQNCVIKPVNYYQVEKINKEVFIDYMSSRVPDWNEKKAEIVRRSSTEFNRLNYNHKGSEEDSCAIVEAWHCSPRDGKHIIATNAGVLLDQPWRFENCPIVSLKNKDPMEGWAGKGEIEELAELQEEVDFILLKIQEIMNLGSINILVDRGAELSIDKLKSNKQFKILEYNGAGGNPPREFIVPVTNNEYFNQIERIRNWAAATAGVNELFLEATKPAGVESGVAIRQISDIASARFRHQGQKYQEFRKEIAERQVDLMRSIQQRGGSIKIFNDNVDSLSEIDLKDFDLEKNSYQFKAWPVNLLPDDPAGQLEQMQNYINGDPALAVRQMNFIDYPDVASMVRREMAPQLLIEKIIDDIATEGKFQEPNEYMDLKYGIKQMTLAFNECMLSNEKEETLELLHDWIVQATEILNYQPPVPGQVPPGAPPGMPGMPPGMPGMPPGAPGMPVGIPVGIPMQGSQSNESQQLPVEQQGIGEVL